MQLVAALAALLIALPAQAFTFTGGTLKGGRTTGIVALQHPDSRANALAFWNFEDTWTNDALTSCGADCDLALSNGSPAFVTTGVREGAKAAEFEAASTEWRGCSDTTCDELRRDGAGASTTWAAYFAHDGADSFGAIMGKRASSAGWEAIYSKIGSSYTYFCCVNATCTAGASRTNGTKVVIVCRFDNASDELTADVFFVDLNSRENMTTTSVTGDIGSTSGVDFRVGNTPQSGQGGGTADAGVVFDGAWSDAETCQYCACGAKGELCDYDASGAWVNRGRIAQCGGCTMPATGGPIT